jgi:hypothetical protein
VRRLVRLYPRAWRERYGAELDALLAETAATPGAVVDVALGAARAHGRVWHARLRSPRTGRLLVLVGGVLWAGLFLAGAMLGIGAYTDELGLPILAALALTLAFGQLALGRGDGPMAVFGGVVSVVGAVLVAGSVVLRLAGGLRVGLDASLEPRGTWDQGMVLFLVGCAIGAMSVVLRSSSMALRAAGTVSVGASVVLAVALVDPLGGPVFIPMLSDSGQTGGGYQGYIGASGWDAGGLLAAAAALVGSVLFIARTPSPQLRLVATTALGGVLAVAAAVVLPWSSGRWLSADVWAASETSGFLQLLAPANGWFPSSDPVVVAGLLFGTGWAVIGWRWLGARTEIEDRRDSTVAPVA